MSRVRFACVSHAFHTHDDSALFAELHIRISYDAVHSHRFGGAGGIIFNQKSFRPGGLAISTRARFSVQDKNSPFLSCR